MSNKYFISKLLLTTATLLILVGCNDQSKSSQVSKHDSGGNLQPTYLRCEYRTDPLGIDVKKPRLSWIVRSDERAQKQTAYQIIVATSLEKLNPREADLWNTNKWHSDNTTSIDYGGKPLSSHVKCYWKVRVWDKNDTESSWSNPAFWSMGMLDPSDLKAKWIGYDTRKSELFQQNASIDTSSLSGCSWVWYPVENAPQSAPANTCYFRKTFEIAGKSKVANAFFNSCVDNSAVVYVNGKKVSSFSGWSPVQNINVKNHLITGKNTIAIAATNEGDSPNPAGLIGALTIGFEDAPPLTIKLDESWKVADSEHDDWASGDFDDSGWQNAKQFVSLGQGPWGDLAQRALILPPPAYLRKDFSVKKQIKRATVYASTLGLYELHINGKRISEDFLTPGWTDYNIRVYYNTYDVTDAVKTGQNAIAAIIADGWYTGYVGYGKKRDHYGTQPWLLTQLCLEYSDGTTEIVTTDRTWKASTGPIIEADFLMGQTYDARLEMPGWDRSDFDQSKWHAVSVKDDVKAEVQAYPGVTVQKFKEIKPVKITEPSEGSFVFDMGTNFAGWARLKVNGKKGDKITLRFAERLNPDGTVYTTNLRSARTIDTYICKGTGVELYEPQFTFHGFQYIELTGFSGKPSKDTLTGIEITSATPVAGSFECSDPVANQLYHNICQTQRSNFIDIPTDCPQRDERLGWTGDAQTYIRTACYNSDTQAFFTKWLVDLADGQRKDGQFPMVAPVKVAGDDGGPAWADAGVICPWTAYYIYDDKPLLQRQYSSMVRFIDFCKNRSTLELLPPEKFHCFGDWLNIKDDTPKDVIYTAYFAASTNLTAKAAQALGKTEDAKKFSKLFEDIRTAFQKAYVSPDGKVKGDTQTAYVLALAYDLLDEPARIKAADHLIRRIKDCNWHLSTGFVGTKDLMLTLAKIGRNDVAYRLFHNDTFPSWGFSVRHGATSIWERWDGWTPDKGFQDPGMNSFAHYSFGAVGQWMFENIGGINTECPGFKDIIIYPQPGGKLTWAKTSYNSIRGRIETNWQLQGDIFKLDVTIPANTTAQVYIPTSSANNVLENNRPADASEGVEFLRMEKDCAVYKVTSGNYSFVSSGVKPIESVK